MSIFDTIETRLKGDTWHQAILHPTRAHQLPCNANIDVYCFVVIVCFGLGGRKPLKPGPPWSQHVPQLHKLHVGNEPLHAIHALSM